MDNRNLNKVYDAHKPNRYPPKTRKDMENDKISVILYAAPHEPKQFDIFSCFQMYHFHSRLQMANTNCVLRLEQTVVGVALASRCLQSIDRNFHKIWYCELWEQILLHQSMDFEPNVSQPLEWLRFASIYNNVFILTVTSNIWIHSSCITSTCQWYTAVHFRRLVNWSHAHTTHIFLSFTRSIWRRQAKIPTMINRLYLHSIRLA